LSTRCRWVIRVPLGRKPERAYVMNLVMREWLGIEHDVVTEDRADVEIRRAGDADGSVLKIPDILFATDDRDWLTVRSLPRLPLSRVAVPASGAWADLDASSFAGAPGKFELPVIYGDGHRGGVAIRSMADGLDLAIDVFGSIFFMLTRYEEVVESKRDVWDRFRAVDSITVREGLVERPLVDEYVNLLFEAMRSLWPTVTPPARTFRLRLTHDVDQPWAVWRRPWVGVVRSALADLGKRHRPSLALRRTRAFVEARRGRLDRDPYDVFDDLMETSERHGLTSAFYFLAGNRPGEVDFRYAEDDSPVRSLMRRIAARGHEIGLHGSHLSFRDPLRLTAEFSALRTAAESAGLKQSEWGVRQHYLRFSVPHTWREQALAGFHYDATVGFAEMPGFRSGTGRDHPVFDVLDRSQPGIIERPLIVMDVSLFEYLGLGHDDALDRVKGIIENCHRQGGQATLLFHNNSLPVFSLEAWYPELVETLTSVC
jgi:peptidoglycan/xylan/chitin deacetylase (PgdA/CDA1 family)